MARTALALLLALTACATTHAGRPNDARLTPRPSDHSVLVYADATDVPRPYLEVARVVGTTEGSPDFATTVSSMQGEAGRIGADALILTGFRPIGRPDQATDTRRAHVVDAIAVRWR